jgi:hypothetical protein
VALFTLGQHLGINSTNQNSRDGREAHEVQNLELKRLCELQAIETATDRKTYGKEEEIEPVAEVSAWCSHSETKGTNLLTTASSASAPGRRTAEAWS